VSTFVLSLSLSLYLFPLSLFLTPYAVTIDRRLLPLARMQIFARCYRRNSSRRATEKYRRPCRIDKCGELKQSPGRQERNIRYDRFDTTEADNGRQKEKKKEKEGRMESSERKRKNEARTNPSRKGNAVLPANANNERKRWRSRTSSKLFKIRDANCASSDVDFYTPITRALVDASMRREREPSESNHDHYEFLRVDDTEETRYAYTIARRVVLSHYDTNRRKYLPFCGPFSHVSVTHEKARDTRVPAHWTTKVYFIHNLRSGR